jgi:hypothetical protein
MKWSLTKQEVAQRDQLLERLNVADNELIAATDVYNAAIEAAWGALEKAIESFNEAAQAAKAFAEDIARERREEYDGKSDRWREGDAASSIDSWITEWEQVELDDVEHVAPEQLQCDTTHAGNFEALDTEAPQ